MAAEMLLADKELTAAEAYRVGFINSILDPKEVVIENGNFFDVTKIPCIPKLLS